MTVRGKPHQKCGFLIGVAEADGGVRLRAARFQRPIIRK